ncbi:SDR family oxidoreductase [Kribbella sp. CA-247076]|uniref:SDR family oxidoreductase n=1 Tax=Kribbella sp. CA-247076 TaxID=3239941 RepID=UPI003D8C637C
MTLLVLGATGSTGRRVTRLLREREIAVRPVSRHSDPRFDWADPKTWAPALDGVTGIYVMAPDGVPVEPAFIEQAVASGVRRLVLLSTMHAEEIDDRLYAAERLVRDAGAEWTVVRANWFNQNFDEGFFLPAIQAGELVVPLGDQRHSFVDAEDIATVAVEALTGSGHHGQTYEVTGPTMHSFAEAVALIAEAADRPIHYKGASADYRQASTAPPDQVEAEIAFFTHQQSFGDSHPTPTVEHLTGRPPIPFPTYAHSVNWPALLSP